MPVHERKCMDIDETCRKCFAPMEPITSHVMRRRWRTCTVCGFTRVLSVFDMEFVIVLLLERFEKDNPFKGIDL